MWPVVGGVCKLDHYWRSASSGGESDFFHGVEESGGSFVELEMVVVMVGVDLVLEF